MLRDREDEKADLETRLAMGQVATHSADILPHPTLLALFRQKVDALHASLNDEVVRPEAATALRTLIESVTIHPNGERGPEAEVRI